MRLASLLWNSQLGTLLTPTANGRVQNTVAAVLPDRYMARILWTIRMDAWKVSISRTNEGVDELDRA
jgi:hypothetical protein